MSTLSPKHQKLSPCSMRALQISRDIPPSQGLSISKAIMAMTSRKLSRASAVLLQGMGNVSRCKVVITAELELAVGHWTISKQTSCLCNHSYIQLVNMSVHESLLSYRWPQPISYHKHYSHCEVLTVDTSTTTSLAQSCSAGAN